MLPLAKTGTVALLLWATFLRGQDAQDKPASKQKESSDPKTKVQEVLQGAVDMIPAATPSVQVAALLDAAALYADSRRTKTIDLLEQAFRAASGVPPTEDRKPEDLQSNVVAVLARYDAGAAAELIAGLPGKARGAPLAAVVGEFIRQKKLEKAIAVLELNATPEAYPYRAATLVLKQLTPDDMRRAQIFSAAASSFTPEGDIQGFSAMLNDQWRFLPQTVLDPAVHRVVSAVLGMKREDDISSSYATSKGAVAFDTAVDAELFDLMVVLKSVDPEGTKKILDQRPRLAATLEKFPEGRGSMTTGDDQDGGDDRQTNMSRRGGGGGAPPDPAMQEQMRLGGVAHEAARQALALAATDLRAGVAKTKDIPLDAVRISTLIRIARGASQKDPGAAQIVLSEAETRLRAFKDPMMASQLWPDLADAARQAKDLELAIRALDRGLSACETLYKQDANADDPNVAPREYWPSMQSLRKLMQVAAATRGFEAEPMLANVADPDLNLMARLALVRGILGKPIQEMEIRVGRNRPRS